MSNNNNLIDLSISLVNTSNWKYLEPCIKSIMANVHNIQYEILVVDNASEDGSPEKLKLLFPEVKLTENTQRFGFAKNNNINLQKSRGRYLMLLNDDTLVQPNSLEMAVEFLDENHDVGVVGCKMINPNGSIQSTSARHFRSLQSTLFSELGLSRKFKYNPIFDRLSIKTDNEHRYIEVDLPQESGMIIRREIIDQVGLLDEQFFMFGEGPDWCRRIKRAGWKIKLLLDCPIIHFGGVTNKMASLKMYLQSYKSTYLYFKKENPISAQFFRFQILVIATLKYIFAFTLSQINKKDNSSTRYPLEYYGALIKLMVFRLNDTTYPFPTN